MTWFARVCEIFTAVVSESQRGPTLCFNQWRRQPKNVGGKMFDFRRITLFCLEKCLSKHKMTIFSENLGGPWPLWLPLATPTALPSLCRHTYVQCDWFLWAQIREYKCETYKNVRHVFFQIFQPWRFRLVRLWKLVILFPPAKHNFHNSVSLNFLRRS